MPIFRAFLKVGGYFKRTLKPRKADSPIRSLHTNQPPKFLPSTPHPSTKLSRSAKYYVNIVPIPLPPITYPPLSILNTYYLLG